VTDPATRSSQLLVQTQGRKQLMVKKLGAVMVAVLAMGALFASVSQAQQWDVAGAKLASGATAAATASTSTTGVLESKVLGSPFKLTSSKLSSKNGLIKQTGTGASGVSTLTGTLVFENVVVDEPAGCKSANIETVPLTGTAQMGNTEATKEGVYVKILPTSGEVFATIKLTECGAAGSYQAKGSVYVKATNPTGTAATSQEGTTSGTINSSQGGALTLGKEPATLTGNINIAVGGSTFALTKE
jgi:hypothetical protein